MLTVSDSAAQGRREDLSGPAVAEALRKLGFHVVAAQTVADEVHDIQAALENLASRRNLMYGKPVLVSGRAILQHTGKLDLFLTADPLDEKLTFAG